MAVDNLITTLKKVMVKTHVLESCTFSIYVARNSKTDKQNTAPIRDDTVQHAALCYPDWALPVVPLTHVLFRADGATLKVSTIHRMDHHRPADDRVASIQHQLSRGIYHVDLTT